MADRTTGSTGGLIGRKMSETALMERLQYSSDLRAGRRPGPFTANINKDGSLIGSSTSTSGTTQQDAFSSELLKKFDKFMDIFIKIGEKLGLKGLADDDKETAKGVKTIGSNFLMVSPKK